MGHSKTLRTSRKKAAPSPLKKRQRKVAKTARRVAPQTHGMKAGQIVVLRRGRKRQPLQITRVSPLP